LRDTQFTRLAEAAHEGDRSALGRLLNGFQPYLHVLADRKLGADLKQKCAGSDLVQRTFLEAQRAFSRFVGSKPDELRAWLERILLNNLVDMARQFRSVEKRQVRREVSLTENWAESDKLVDRSTPSKNVSAREEKERLRHALAHIPEDYRQVIVLRNLERQPFKEIAVAMGRSVEAVKKLWSRAIMHLKEAMKEHERP
jgi:RNA polymerase sigma-70 factor, ECF subfamily